jgi:2'-5' RNA ligase
MMPSRGQRVHVIVAVIPPSQVLDEVEATLALLPPPAGEFEPTSRTGLLIPVMTLGNVTRPQASEIADLLREGVGKPGPPPEVGLRGVWALEDDGDPTVALPLVGDVDRLDQLARSLPTLVAKHGFFVDRRRWAPRLTLGSVTPTTSLPFLERLVDHLAGHTSQTWSVDSIALARRRFDGSPDAWEVIETVGTTART